MLVISSVLESQMDISVYYVNSRQKYLIRVTEKNNKYYLPEEAKDILNRFSGSNLVYPGFE